MNEKEVLSICLEIIDKDLSDSRESFISLDEKLYSRITEIETGADKRIFFVDTVSSLGISLYPKRGIGNFSQPHEVCRALIKLLEANHYSVLFGRGEFYDSHQINRRCSMLTNWTEYFTECMKNMSF